MDKKDKHSKTGEDALFRDAVGPVKPVTQRRANRRPPQPKPHARFSRADDEAALRESLTDVPDPADVESGEELLFARPAVTRRTLRQLRRGQFAIQGEIDLHGMKLDEARAALDAFVVAARARHARCVRVIHGKGLGSGPRGPVIKAGVNRWLRSGDAVMAFCSARPHDGGTGAVYVLLK